MTTGPTAPLRVGHLENGNQVAELDIGVTDRAYVTLPVDADVDETAALVGDTVRARYSRAVTQPENGENEQ